MTFKERFSRTVPSVAGRLGPKAGVRISNPIQYRRGPMSCPDPDVFVWGPLYVATGTSDIGQYNPLPDGMMGPAPAAFPIYWSRDLATWYFANYIFPQGQVPPGANPPTGSWTFSGRYWAPELHSIGGQYVAYFGAQKTNGKMAIFVAWTKHLFGGAWQSKVLIDHDGSIDPSVWWIGPQLHMVYTHQPNSVWLTKLSADGLTAEGNGVQISEGNLPWEKDTNGHYVEEGPVLWTYKDANGKWTTYCFFNAASTWDPTYAIGVLIQQPDGSWKKHPEPILSAGPELVSTGLGTQPFRTASGKLFISFHCQFAPELRASYGRALAVLRPARDGERNPDGCGRRASERRRHLAHSRRIDAPQRHAGTHSPVLNGLAPSNDKPFPFDAWRSGPAAVPATRPKA